MDDIFGSFGGECRGCDCLGRLNDLGLCQDCAGILERDLIRQRGWDYSVTAYGVPSPKREELRDRVVDQYGEKLELLAPENDKKKGKSRNRKKRKASAERNKRKKARSAK